MQTREHHNCFEAAFGSVSYMVEPASFIRWDEKAGLRRDAIRSQRLTRSRRNGKETGYDED